MLLEERREKVYNLHEQGKTQEEINAKYLEREKRRERVVELYNQGKSQEEIAKELGVKDITIGFDIKCLIEMGKIQERIDVTTLEIEKRRKKAVKLYNQGKMQKRINAKTLEMERRRKEEGSNAKYLERDKRRERVVELYNQGKSQEKIAKELGANKITIGFDIKCLMEMGKIQERINVKTLEKRKNKKTPNANTLRIEKRRRKVLELYNQGKNKKEIADEVGASKDTIRRDIIYLENIGEIQPRATQRRTNMKKRQEKVVVLYSFGKIPREIAEQLGEQPKLINQDVNKLVIEGKINLSEIGAKEKLEEYITAKKYKEAKEFIDKCLNDPHMSAEFKTKLVKFKMLMEEREAKKENKKSDEKER